MPAEANTSFLLCRKSQQEKQSLVSQVALGLRRWIHVHIALIELKASAVARGSSLLLYMVLGSRPRRLPESAARWAALQGRLSCSRESIIAASLGTRRRSSLETLREVMGCVAVCLGLRQHLPSRYSTGRS